MHSWMLLCWVVPALVWAEDCPAADGCAEGHTCCSSPGDGFACCPFEQAVCCEDQVHCCPEETRCDVEASCCVNDTASVPWTEGRSAPPPTLSKSFRMVRSYDTEEDDNICPDESRCPPEYSCLKALTRFNCCPLAKGISCSDGKHCCPEGHGCTADSRSCIRKEFVSPVICSDGESECPEETTCCQNSDSSWGCCPIPEATCCEDMAHCCPGGSVCDVQQSKCVSLSTKKETPMWAKLHARRIAEWERAESEKEQETVPALSGEESLETPSEVTAETPPNETPNETPSEVNTETPPTETPNETPSEVNTETPPTETPNETPSEVNTETPPTETPNETPSEVNTEGTTEWTPAGLLEDATEPLSLETTSGNDVQCNKTYSCLDGETCCKTLHKAWGCCPLPEAVCCEDLIHCCPHGKTCNPKDQTCDDGFTQVPWVEKSAAIPTRAALENPSGAEASGGLAEEETSGDIQCDTHTRCPQQTTCCYMVSAKKWGCCPVPKAVCCSDGAHCCPEDYTCDESAGLCYRGQVAIPWYTKVPAVGADSAAPDSVALGDTVPCDGETRCPVHFTCCPLSTGQWGCCPLYEAVCCPDQQHCCPWGYSCNDHTASCQQVTVVQWNSLPFTRVVLPRALPRPHLTLDGSEEELGGSEGEEEEAFPCQGPSSSCPEEETCCRTSSNTWACCSSPNAVCCDDMEHCCPAGHTCGEGGTCSRNIELQWKSWHLFFSRPGMRALKL